MRGLIGKFLHQALCRVHDELEMRNVELSSGPIIKNSFCCDERPCSP